MEWERGTGKSNRYDYWRERAEEMGKELPIIVGPGWSGKTGRVPREKTLDEILGLK
jgi:hypothetical protein